MQTPSSLQSNWLRSYYFTRAAFSMVWISAAILFAGQSRAVAFLLVVYPLWDALANLIDAKVNGGLQANPSQTLNVAVSTVTALAVIIAVSNSTYAVLAVFGAWAILSGLLQLYTGVRRWRTDGAQWVMILSGAQSALAGGFMISQSFGIDAPTILDIVPYAGFGAFYFLLSSIWLVVAARRKAHA
ncbi:DUF308 domain-containing protein [Rhizobium hidalgonense]|uniref:DUF308 domain-containing protein n=1 Tax=Rhizobium hidalgonense TaxID=1538159 RepID=A0A2A6KEJ6_9HYPH|nr:DUF308 domain-containing protein [Rhizobium hidalgonense]MDR9772640.1 DUF308 domain-containing protein [Rhizobium hidalgonense]MDR9813815.1 DUF308 domain-containing protein [Rhizobium hidalgonense]MDR9821768.1 DUF308 domain-containing protein [Rhizobium hidalgonense]PDT23336.1 hypothetical protein CO674_12900 [Rhizobium hidalgonense]PON02536.1 hypothetical protein ATY29_33220 [Rhizobium hidalgonense]